MKKYIEKFSIITAGVHLLVCVAMFVILISAGVGIAGNVKGSLNISFFDTGEMPVIMELSGNSIPEEVELKVINDNGEIEDITLKTKSDNFKRTYIEMYQNKDKTFEMISPVFNDSKKVVIDKNNYSYSTYVNLKGKIKEGENIVVITFNIRNKNFRIANQVTITQGVISFNKKDISVDYSD